MGSEVLQVLFLIEILHRSFFLLEIIFPHYLSPPQFFGTLEVFIPHSNAPYARVQMVRNLWSIFGFPGVFCFCFLKWKKGKGEVGKENGYFLRNTDFMKEYIQNLRI